MLARPTAVLLPAADVSPWRLEAAICPAVFVALLHAFAAPALLPAMASDLATEPAVLGQLPALTLLLAAGLGLGAGPLARRIGARRLLLLGIASVAGATLAAAAAPTYWLLFAAAPLGALARATVQPMSYATLAARLDGPARQRAVGRTVTSFSLAAVLGLPGLTAIGALAGWRAAYLAAALAAAAAFAGALALLPPDAADTPPGAHPTRPSGAVLGAVGASLCRSAGTWMFATYLGVFLTSHRGLEPAAVGWALGLMGLGNLVGAQLAGRLPAGGLRRRLALVHALHGFAMAAPLLLPLGSAVLPLLALMFVLNGAADVGEPALLVETAGTERTSALALQGAALSLGGALGASLGGALLLLGGYPALTTVLPLFGLVAAACTAANPGKKEIA